MAMTAPRPLGYWVKTLDRLLDEQFEQAADSTGLSPGEWRVLNRLAVGAEQSTTAEESLAPLVDRDTTAADTLASLEKAGLVEQRAHEHRLTNDGYARVDQVESAASDRIGERLGDLEEYDALLARLEGLAKALGWTPL